METHDDRPPQLVRLVWRGGRLYMVYSGSAVPRGPGYAACRWYAEPFPPESRFIPAESFATPEEAERSIVGDP